MQVGHGREVCGVLDGLADYVLERRNFTYRKPLYLPDTCVGAFYRKIYGNNDAWCQQTNYSYKNGRY